jgi:transposase
MSHQRIRERPRIHWLRKSGSGRPDTLPHRISNGAAEGFNSRIQSIKSAARGFRSIKNYRTRILFFCGKLKLNPDISH